MAGPGLEPGTPRFSVVRGAPCGRAEVSESSVVSGIPGGVCVGRGRGRVPVGTPGGRRAGWSVVGAPARLDAEHDDDELIVVESQEDAPVADAQAGLGARGELDEVGGERVGGEAVEGVEDAPADGRVETP
jgi:hypothetical protein